MSRANPWESCTTTTIWVPPQCCAARSSAVSPAATRLGCGGTQAIRANCKWGYQELDSRFRGNDIALKLFSVMPALRLRSGQAPAGIQDRLLLRVNANEIRSQFLLNHRRGWASLSPISRLRTLKLDPDRIPK